MAVDMAQDAGTGCLVWAIFGSCPCDDEGKVEDDTKRSNSNDYRRNGNANLPEIVRERTTEE